MTEDQRRPPSDDEIAAWIRLQPEVWPQPPAPSGESDERWSDAIANRVLAGERKRRRRRSRRGVIGGVTVLVVAGGAVGAAALLRDGQPSTPEAGPACRAEARLDAEAVVVPAGGDPIAGCLEVWESGRFPQFMTPDGIPALVACIGPNGAVEVFPGPLSMCGELGLVPADPMLSPENEAIVQLQDVLVRSINAAGCVGVEDATRIAQGAINDVGLIGWIVELEPGTTQGCAKAAVDSETKRVVISEL